MALGSPVATRWANTWPDPGVALNPPVPQPQLTKRPGTSVFDRIGERSGVVSTMPPQLRSILSRDVIGNISTIASSVAIAICGPPVWLYET